jgi:hypothetical protein
MVLKDSMYRPKDSNPPSAAPRRHTLEDWTRTPTIDDVRRLLEEATAKRGMLIDVTIRRDPPPIFVLTIQWEPNLQEPVWSLYEGADGAKTCWNYPNANLDMIYEIICMSLPGGIKSSSPSTLGTAAHTTMQIQEDKAVATPPAPPPMPANPPLGQPTAQPPNPYGQPVQPMPPLPYPQNAPYPPQMPGAPGYPPGYPPQQMPYQQQMPYPQQMPGYQQPPPGYPPGYPQVPPGYQPGYPPAPSPQGFPQATPYPNQAPQHYQQPAAAPQPPPAAAPELRPFIDLLNKGQSQMMLGHLFIEAGVLPEPCVEAALKLQELVRKGLLSNSAAIDALKRAAESGGTLDDEIIAACRSKYPTDSLTQSVPVLKPTTLDPREFNRQVIQLIQQSGIVTDNDVATAEGVRKKHGGDVGSILVAAGKLERATLDAAKRCQPLVREHRLNHEEAYRILRHCQKNKSSIEEAFRVLSIRVL